MGRLADYTDDLDLTGDPQRRAEAYRKIRNTARFLLSNLFDFDPLTNAVPPAALQPRRPLARRRTAFRATTRARPSSASNFTPSPAGCSTSSTTDLLGLSCDVRKDAFYVLAADDPDASLGPVVRVRITETLALSSTRSCPLTAEEIWESLPRPRGDLSEPHHVGQPRPLAAHRRGARHGAASSTSVRRSSEPSSPSAATASSARARRPAPRSG